MDLFLLPAQRAPTSAIPEAFSPSQTFKHQDYSAGLFINTLKALELEGKAAADPCKVLTASVTALLSRDEPYQNFLT